MLIYGSDGLVNWEIDCFSIIQRGCPQPSQPNQTKPRFHQKPSQPTQPSTGSFPYMTRYQHLTVFSSSADLHRIAFHCIQSLILVGLTTINPSPGLKDLLPNDRARQRRKSQNLRHSLIREGDSQRETLAEKVMQLEKTRKVHNGPICGWAKYFMLILTHSGGVILIHSSHPAWARHTPNPGRESLIPTQLWKEESRWSGGSE